MGAEGARKGEYATMERGTVAGAPDHLQLLQEGVRLFGSAQRVEGDPRAHLLAPKQSVSVTHVLTRTTGHTHSRNTGGIAHETLCGVRGRHTGEVQ